jgi:hypothetical protein
MCHRCKFGDEVVADLGAERIFESDFLGRDQCESDCRLGPLRFLWKRMRKGYVRLAYQGQLNLLRLIWLGTLVESIVVLFGRSWSNSTLMGGSKYAGGERWHAAHQDISEQFLLPPKHPSCSRYRNGKTIEKRKKWNRRRLRILYM